MTAQRRSAEANAVFRRIEAGPRAVAGSRQSARRLALPQVKRERQFQPFIEGVAIQDRDCRLGNSVKGFHDTRIDVRVKSGAERCPLRLLPEREPHLHPQPLRPAPSARSPFARLLGCAQRSVSAWRRHSRPRALLQLNPSQPRGVAA